MAIEINLIKHKGNLIPFDSEAREKIDLFQDGAIYRVKINNSDRRTIQQNRAIHLFCDKISDTLNKEKLVVQDVIKINTYWTMERVKDLIFKPVVKSLYNKDSTTKLNKDELDKIIDTIVYYLAKKGIECPEFPSRENI